MSVLLNGLGQAILGNFSTDQMVIESLKYQNDCSKLYKNSNYTQENQEETWMDKTAERIEMDCIWLNLKNVGPPFFKFISVYIKMSFTQVEKHS